MTDDREPERLGSVAMRIVAGLKPKIDAIVDDLNAERAATDATTTTLAWREAEIRERERATKTEPREAAE